MAKREVPGAVKAVLKMDDFLTKNLCIAAAKIAKPAKIKGYLNALEISCHGLLWLVGWPVYIMLLWHKDLFQMQVNFFMGLVLDLLSVALLKAYFRRRRPPGSPASGLGPDAYSFPSGHASRSFLVFLFFSRLHPLDGVWSSVILAWALSVALSRLLLRMHYLLDVIAGLALASLNALLLSWLWLSRDTTDWLVFLITDERFDGDGGEYHHHHTHSD